MFRLFNRERPCILHAHLRSESIVTMHRVVLVASSLFCCLAPAATPAAAADGVNAPVRLAQAAQPQPQPAPAPATPATAAPAAAAQAPEEPIGNVATVTGNATVTRNDAATPLKVKDDIYLNDVLQTSAKSSLGVTFNDATTFNLTANAKITVDGFVYEEGGKKNAALFEVARGTVAFVAASVAKTGDMKISTPTATLGIRGTTGLVEVPEGAAANSPNNVAIKLYPDADGKVGRIEVNDRAGLRLGFLTQGASGFTIRPGAGGSRFAAVPLTISPQQILRDQGFVRQVHSTQTLGRRVVTEQRAFRRANPGLVNPNRPNRTGQPGQQRQNNLQNRPGPQQQPGLPNRQGLPQRSGSPAQLQPGAAPRPGQPPAVQGQPGMRSPPGAPTPAAPPNAPGVAPRPNLQQPNLQPPAGIRQTGPGQLRPGLQNRPALQRRPAASPQKRQPRDIR
jgi:FecR protein